MRGCFGRYGNLRGWPIGEGGNSTAAKSIAFFNVCKYPPSLAYAFITLGVVQLLLVGLRKMAAAAQATQVESAAAGADNMKLASRGWLSPGHPSSPAQGKVQPQSICRFFSVLRARVLAVLLVYGRSPPCSTTILYRNCFALHLRAQGVRQPQGRAHMGLLLRGCLSCCLSSS